MRIYIERSEEKKKIVFQGKASDLLEQLSINPQTVIIVKNNELVTEDEPLENDDEISLLTVVSGG
jgi:sulfur carrier protein